MGRGPAGLVKTLRIDIDLQSQVRWQLEGRNPFRQGRLKRCPFRRFDQKPDPMSAPDAGNRRRGRSKDLGPDGA